MSSINCHCWGGCSGESRGLPLDPHKQWSEVSAAKLWLMLSSVKETKESLESNDQDDE